MSLRQDIIAAIGAAPHQPDELVINPTSLNALKRDCALDQCPSLQRRGDGRWTFRGVLVREDSGQPSWALLVV